MLKKTITYMDYNGVTQTEDFYFSLTEAEITELELSENGGFTAFVRGLINTRDSKKLSSIFKELICKAYGEKSADGKRFVKEDRDGYPLYKDFLATDAYSKLYMELITVDGAAADFINHVIPQSLYDQVVAAKAIEDAGGVSSDAKT